MVKMAKISAARSTTKNWSMQWWNSMKVS